MLSPGSSTCLHVEDPGEILFSLSIYTRILPPLERTLGSSTSLVQIAGSVSNLATDLVQSMHPRTR